MKEGYIINNNTTTTSKRNGNKNSCDTISQSSSTTMVNEDRRQGRGQQGQEQREDEHAAPVTRRAAQIIMACMSSSSEPSPSSPSRTRVTLHNKEATTNKHNISNTMVTSSTRTTRSYPGSPIADNQPTSAMPSASASSIKFLVKQKQLEHLLLSTSKYGLSPRGTYGTNGVVGRSVARDDDRLNSYEATQKKNNHLSVPSLLQHRVDDGDVGEPPRLLPVSSSNLSRESETLKPSTSMDDGVRRAIPLLTTSVEDILQSRLVKPIKDRMMRQSNATSNHETAFDNEKEEERNAVGGDNGDNDDGHHYVEMTALEEPWDEAKDYSKINTLGSSSIGREHRRQRLRSESEQQQQQQNEQQLQRQKQSRRSNFVLHDKIENMTWSRRFALSYQNEFWYNPNYSPEAIEAAASLEEEAAADDNEYRIIEHLQAPQTTVATTRSSRSRDDTQYGPEQRPPMITKQTIPSLETAWAYHEHFALPRYIASDSEDESDNNKARDANDGKTLLPSSFWNNRPLQRAEPGENNVPTKLYDPFFTPLSQMGDFGLGIGLYFSTLLALAVLTFAAGLVNIPNIIYFLSEGYSDGQTTITNPLLKGSAICTRTQWVPCINCNITSQDFTENRFYSYAVSSNGNDDANMYGSSMLSFALKNECDGATMQQGLINYSTLFVILIGILVLYRYQKKMQVKFDEDEQTAQDYSIRIKNPPGDATDPDEWKDFFHNSFGAHATVVTTALDNDNLVNALRERRECVRKIELLVEPGTSMDHSNLARKSAEVQQSRTAFQHVTGMFMPEIPELFRRKAELEAMIVGWAQLDYPCSNVFVSFETEADQRKVLSALNVGKFDVHRNATEKVHDSRHLFRGIWVLEVSEPDEPNTIRWQDLNIKFVDKLQPLLTTTLSCIIIICGIELLIRHIHQRSVMYAATAIAFFNVLFPLVAKELTKLERHSSENQAQTSLYFKIAFFRWVNTAIIMSIITPFTHTLQSDTGEIPSIYAIFFAEIVTTNLIQISDAYGLFQRHVLAPRATTQDAMNLLMLGEEVELAERYTNMTKIVFLGLWYCSIYPAALFFCSFALFINYFTDRYSLMRCWKRLPNLGTRIAEFSLRYFMPSAVVAMAVVSSLFWSGFPYDNLCPYEDGVPYKYQGSHTFEMNGESISLTLTADDVAYRYCSQDFLSDDLTHHFPTLSFWQPEGDEWMTSEQERLVNIYGVTSVLVLIGVVGFFFYQAYEKLRKYFVGKYEAVGDDQGINYSDVKSISAYVPQVNSAVYSYPLLACDVKIVDPKVLGWTDPDRYHTYYDLTQDAKELLSTSDHSLLDKEVFSRLAHYPPQQEGKGRMTDHKFV